MMVQDQRMTAKIKFHSSGFEEASSESLILLYPLDSQDKIKAEVFATLKNCFPKYCWFTIVWDIESIADNNETKAFDAYHRSQTSACE
jgi:hypothetical protein